MKHAPLILALLLCVASTTSVLLHGGFLPQGELCRFLPCRAEVRVKMGVAPQSISHLKEVVVQDPASPYRWCDLAEALLQAEQIETARYCFQRAIQLGPNIPPVLMRAANFHLVLAEQKQALPLTRHILELTREYQAIIFSSYRRAGVSVAEALEAGIPATGPAAQSYFLHLLQAGSPEEAALSWRRLERNRCTDDKLAAKYVEFLLAHKLPSQAAEAWSEHLGSRRGDYMRTNHLFNGGFESEPLPGPLDWRIVPIQGVQAERDFTQFRSGKASLRLAFNGERNLAYTDIFQTAVVGPGRWRFSAFIRTQDITTDQRPAFRLYDFEDRRRLEVTLDQATGTMEWTEMAREFTVRPSTRVIRVQLERRPSQRLDNKIGGTAWVDAITLVPLK